MEYPSVQKSITYILETFFSSRGINNALFVVWSHWGGKSRHGFGHISLVVVVVEQKLIAATTKEIPTVSLKTNLRFLVANGIFAIVLA